jgi:hypothetical protein
MDNFSFIATASTASRGHSRFEMQLWSLAHQPSYHFDKKLEVSCLDKLPEEAQWIGLKIAQFQISTRLVEKMNAIVEPLLKTLFMSPYRRGGTKDLRVDALPSDRILIPLFGAWVRFLHK